MNGQTIEDPRRVALRKILVASGVLLSMLTMVVKAPPAQAHGEAKPKHGGVVSMAADLSFELVGTPAGAVIHVEDHGKPLSTAGMKGNITVLQGTAKQDAVLTAAGERLEAAGVKLAPGAKVVASITTPTKKAITVRFTVK
jgi:hypothetical protein